MPFSGVRGVRLLLCLAVVRRSQEWPASLSPRPSRPNARAHSGRATCGGAFEMNTGDVIAVTSPLYPDQHPRRQKCSWQLQPAMAHDTVELICTDVDLVGFTVRLPLGQQLRLGDYLRVTVAGRTRVLQNRDILHCSDVPYTVTGSPGQPVVVEFSSDIVFQRRGFSCQARVTSPTIATSSGSPTSRQCGMAVVTSNDEGYATDFVRPVDVDQSTSITSQQSAANVTTLPMAIGSTILPARAVPLLANAGSASAQMVVPSISTTLPSTVDSTFSESALFGKASPSANPFEATSNSTAPGQLSGSPSTPGLTSPQPLSESSPAPSPTAPQFVPKSPPPPGRDHAPAEGHHSRSRLLQRQWLGRTGETVTAGRLPPHSAEARVAGGVEATPDVYPWAVFLSMEINGRSGFVCGGSLISRRFVLTAAHCVYRAGAATVFLGYHTLRQPGPHSIRLAAVEALIHPGWSSATVQHDIALLRLERPVDYSVGIQPICLPTRAQAGHTFAGVTGSLLGWGGRVAGQSLVDTLRVASAAIMSNCRCQLAWPAMVSPLKLCVVGRHDAAACAGDSGGLLQVTSDQGNAVQVGVVSWGSRFGCESGLPSGFTRITPYLDWIQANSDVTIPSQ